MKRLFLLCMIVFGVCYVMVSCNEMATQTTENRANTSEVGQTTTDAEITTTEAPFSQVGVPITITVEELSVYLDNERSGQHGMISWIDLDDGYVAVVETTKDYTAVVRAERFEDRTGKATMRDLAQIKVGMSYFDMIAVLGLPIGHTSGRGDPFFAVTDASKQIVLIPVIGLNPVVSEEWHP